MVENVDALNAILSQSSIKSASESAFERNRRQQALAIQALRNRAAQNRLGATLGIRQEEGALDRANRNAEGALNRAAAKERAEIMADKLSGGMRADVASGQANLGNIDTAIDAATQVVEQGGEFKGATDVMIGFLREFGANTVSNIVSQYAYDKDERRARSAIIDATSEIRRALSGAALTEQEIGINIDAAPDAAGISMEESIRRLRDWRNKTERAMRAILPAPLQPASPVQERPNVIIRYEDMT